MRKRGAFSLLEVSISLVLGMVLLLAVFETFFVTARYRLLAGESHASGLALTNAMRDLASDLAAVESELPRVSQPTITTPAESKKLRSKLFTQPLSLRDAFAMESRVEWAGFVGKENYVAFRTNAWNSRFTRAPGNVLAAGESFVVWWIYRGAPIRVEGWRSKDLPITKSLKVPRNASGLIRTQFFIDKDGNEIETSQIILPEATSLRLRYFADEGLIDGWDQKTDEGLPTAVEVRFAFDGQVAQSEVEHWISIPAH